MIPDVIRMTTIPSQIYEILGGVVALWHSCDFLIACHYDQNHTGPQCVIVAHTDCYLGGFDTGLLCLDFLRLTVSISTLLLRLVVRMGLFVVDPATATEEEQNLLSVARAHTISVRDLREAVKRIVIVTYGC